MKLLRQTTFALLFAAQLASQAGAQKEQFPINFVNQFKQAQDHRQEADKKLIENMEAVADWLVKYRLRVGHFPEMGVEQDKATNYLQNKLMKPNPYSLTGVASVAEGKAICPLRFVSEVGLNDYYRQEWEKKVPSDWRAEPGCVTVIMNEYNNVLLWGAGADHLPVYDGKNNKSYFSWRAISK